MRLHALGRARERDQLVLADRRRHLQTVAQLAVHLQHDLDRLPVEHRLVRDRPRLLPQARASQHRPELLGDVRRVRLDERHRGLGREAGGRIVGLARDLVHELHHRRDRRIQREATADVVGHFRDRLVRLARERPGRCLHTRLPRLLVDDAPEPVQEADDALETGVLPLGILLDRPDEEQVHAHRVGAVTVDVVVGRDHVSLRLGHLRALVVEHPLGEEAGERLPEPDQPEVVHHLGEEPRVEQVQDRVLDAPDVLVHRQPVVGDLARERLRVVVRVGVADVVPGRVDEGVHRVGLARGGSATARTVDDDPVLGGRQRRAAFRQVILDLGEKHRQLVVRDGHVPAALAVHDRDRAAPVALPREQPVPQAVADRRLGHAALGQPGNDRLLALRGGHAVELRRVDQDFALGVRDESIPLLGLALRGPDDLPDLEAVALRERVVALVVCGHGHDCAGAVLHQHVVGDPDRDPLAVDGVDRVLAREDTVLLLPLPLDGGAASRVTHVLPYLLGIGEGCDERVLRREHEEGGSEERVGPGREDGQILARPLDGEDDARALGAADPVALHRQHPLRPLLEQLHLVEQGVGVVGDLEEPLRQALRLDLRAAALAAAVDHLLIGEHRLVDRAPIDQRLLAVGETALVEAQEEPLRPAVVLRLVRRDLAIPVDRPAHAAHLVADRGDVPLGHLARVATLLDCGVLRVQAERVVAHRPHHHEAVAASEVRDDLAEHVVANVPHVELAGRVREHLQDIGLARVLRRARLRVRHREGARVLPDPLPLCLDRLRVVPLAHLGLRVQKSLSCERPVGSSRSVAAFAPVLRKKLRSCHCSTI